MLISEWIDSQDWTEDEKAYAYNVCAVRSSRNLNPPTSGEFQRIMANYREKRSC